ncbi:MAG: hypothetical protein J5836_03240 [Clostridia bacterium]|nr:hypothetical protein [Clostridia bacterium]
MKTVQKDDYSGVCDARGCTETAEAAISLYGVEPDLHLCGKCLKKLAASLNAYSKEKK